MNELDFPNQEPLDYFRWLNLQHPIQSLLPTQIISGFDREIRQAIEGKIEPA